MWARAQRNYARTRAQCFWRNPSDRRIVGSSDRRPRAGDFWCNPNVRFHNVVACVSGVWRESFLGFGATPRTSTHNSVCRRISTHICAYLHILVRICVYRPIAHTYTKNPRARFASLSVWHGSITPKIPEHTCSGIFGVSVVVVGTVELHQKSPSTVCITFCNLLT